MVFQDPYSSLNPRLSVGEIVGEPLLVHKIAGRPSECARCCRASASIPPAASGSPASSPVASVSASGSPAPWRWSRNTMVLDEPVSALDVSIQASVLNLLRDLQRNRNMAYLFIAHDLAVVRQVADEVAVMYLGLIVEQGPADARSMPGPAHPYTTRADVGGARFPTRQRERSRQRILLRGEVPSPANPPSGCRFRTRCWKADARARRRCRRCCQIETGRHVACHYPETGAWPASCQEGRVTSSYAWPLTVQAGRGPAPARFDRAPEVRGPAVPRRRGH